MPCSSGSLCARRERRTQSFTVVSIQKNIQPRRDKRILRLYRIWPLIPKSYVVSEGNRYLLISERESSQIRPARRTSRTPHLAFAKAMAENSGKWKDKRALTHMHVCLWRSLPNSAKSPPPVIFGSRPHPEQPPRGSMKCPSCEIQHQNS